MKPVWMWAEDPSDGWAGEQVVRRARGLEETRLGQFVPPTELPSEGGPKL